MIKNKKILVGMSGSFCNHKKVLLELEKLAKDNDLTFVLSHNVAKCSTRFLTNNELRKSIANMSNNEIIEDIVEAEKVGPNNCYDLMVVSPCTATQCAKFIHGIYDDPLTLSMKAMVRNQKKIIIGFASNDGLGISGRNVFQFLMMRYCFLVPIAQDDPINKPNSLVAVWNLLIPTIENALHDKQIQPVIKETYHENI